MVRKFKTDFLKIYGDPYQTMIKKDRTEIDTLDKIPNFFTL